MGTGSIILVRDLQKNTRSIVDQVQGPNPMTKIDIPDVLNLRLIDGARAVVIRDAIARQDRPRLLAVCSDALQILWGSNVRRWPGRFKNVDWTVRARQSIENLHRRLKDDFREETVDVFPLWEDVEITATDLLCAFAMPWFQVDYLLETLGSNEQWHVHSAVMRDYPIRNRYSTLELETAQESRDFFRTLCRPNAGVRRLMAQIKDVEPCSFVGLGFLDDGVYRRLLNDDIDGLEELLGALQRTKQCFEDVMWLASPTWLTELSKLLEGDGRSSDLRGRIAKLEATAQENGLQIAVSGTFGDTYNA